MSLRISCTLSQVAYFFGKEILESIYFHIKNAGKLIETTGGKVQNNAGREIDNDNERQYLLLPSSRQTILLYQFPVSEVTSFLLKSYRLPFTDIARHYISVQSFKSQMSTSHFSFEEKLVKLTVADVFGIGIFQLDNLSFPFMIQKLSKGLHLSKLGKMEYKITHSLLPAIFKKISKTGFIIDPYPHNWFIYGYSQENDTYNNCILEYIDLLYENSLTTINKANQVINSLEPLLS